LVKTKVLLHQLGRKDLVEWVNNEINGYDDNAPLPAYRILEAGVRGDVSNGVYSYSSHPLPTLHLEKNVRERFEKVEMRDSIAVLERLADDDKQGLQRPLPIEACALFSKALTGGYQVQRAWCALGVGRMAQILSQVRSKLLDFLLELSERIGEDMSEEEVKRVAQSPETGSMFNHAIFGDNVTILVGDHGQQTVKNEVYKGDLSSLSSFLRKHKVPEEDIIGLQEALKEDATCPEIQERKFGPRVKKWLEAMLGKAVNTAWQIELGIASGLLTKALQTYYGW
jgi:hypothetical protein